jgi:hypothetical protein
MKAFDEVKIDPTFYTHRQRSLDEIFPWDHISTGVRKKYLLQDLRKSRELQTQADCRTNCYACGILPTFAEMRRETPGDAWFCPEVKSPSRQKSPLPIDG